MVDFAVQVVKIDNVIRHPNADKLAICQIGGFNCITADLEDGTQRYNSGDYVVYIPEASIVPDWLLQKMDFWSQGMGTLSGSAKNRVKIIKLRGEFSQGLMYPVISGPVNTVKIISDFGVIEDKEIKHSVVAEDGQEYEVQLGDDVSELLGVKKYEPAIPAQFAGKLGALFGLTKTYDVESIQKFKNVFNESDNVVVTEKIHGTCFIASFIKNPPEDKKELMTKITDTVYSFVTSKGLAKSGLIQQNSGDNQGNVYVKIYNEYFRDTGIDMTIANDISEDDSTTQLFVYGEIFGNAVQAGFTYGKKTQELRIFDVFEKDTDGTTCWCDDIGLDYFCEKTGLKRVPVLYRGPYSYEKMIELRDGMTVEGEGSHIREGIVIRNILEVDDNIRGLFDGRKQVKFVSPAYLMKSTGEEFN